MNIRELKGGKRDERRLYLTPFEAVASSAERRNRRATKQVKTKSGKGKEDPRLKGVQRGRQRMKTGEGPYLLKPSRGARRNEKPKPFKEGGRN